MMAAVEHFEWNKICVLHRDDNYGIQGALATSDAAKAKGINVLVVKSFSHKTSNATQAATEAVTFGCRIFVVWCIHCDKAMHSILNVGNPNLKDRTKYAWIMSDGCTGAMSEYSKYSGLEEAVIGVMCVSPHIPPNAAKSKFLSAWDVQTHGQPSDYALFVYDAVIALAHAIERSAVPAQFITGPGDKCLENPLQNENKWAHGERVRNELLNVRFMGTTSGDEELRLSSNFERSTASYTISNVQGFTVPSGGKLITEVVVAKANVSASGDVKIGFEGAIQWNADKTMYANRPADGFRISSRLVKVITISNGMPFNDIDLDNKKCENWERTCPKFTGKYGPYYKCPVECYMGLAFDLMKYISGPEQLDFAFEAYHTKSGYGYTPTIKQGLIDSDFDIVVGDFTATSERSEFVQMSYPFYDLGLQIVMLKENNQKAEAVVMIFSPFTSLVWICLALYILFAALLFWIFEHGSNPQIPDWNCKSRKKTARPARRSSRFAAIREDDHSGILNSIRAITAFTLN